MKKVKYSEVIDFLLKELEATERKLAEAEKVVEAASLMWDSVDLIQYILGDDSKGEAFLEALSDYEASKREDMNGVIDAIADEITLKLELEKLSNDELVKKAITDFTDETWHPVVEVMMDRLSPEWEGKDEDSDNQQFRAIGKHDKDCSCYFCNPII